MLAHRRRAQKRRHVLRHASPLQRRQVLRQRRPCDVVLDVAHLLDGALFHFGRQGPHRAALAENLRRDAFSNLSLRTAIRDQRVRRPRQHVDEARRDCKSSGIDDRLGGCLRQIANPRDPIALDPHVGATPGGATAVVDHAAANHDVEAGLWLRSDPSARCEQHRRHRHDERSAQLHRGIISGRAVGIRNGTDAYGIGDPGRGRTPRLWSKPGSRRRQFPFGPRRRQFRDKLSRQHAQGTKAHGLECRPLPCHLGPSTRMGPASHAASGSQARGTHPRSRMRHRPADDHPAREDGPRSRRRRRPLGSDASRSRRAYGQSAADDAAARRFHRSEQTEFRSRRRRGPPVC